MKKNQFLTLMLGGILACSCTKQDELLPETKTGETKTTANQIEPFTPTLKNDSLALLAFYNAMSGEQWPTWLNNWKKTPVRKWYGVKTEKINGEHRITEIRLQNMKLKGQLPKELKNLTELKVLALSENAGLTGNIIDEVYTLKKLQTLCLNFTNLTGTLSPAIGNLTELDTLSLWTGQWVLEGVSHNPNPNRMSGKLPQELGKLTKLSYLNLARQAFTGNLPTEIGNMANLRFLDISENELTGGIPASIGDLKNLYTLFGGRNHFNEALPEEICGMDGLAQLYLDENEIPGQIPAHIGNLKKIHEINLSHNKMTGHIPASLEKADELGLLYLNDNQLDGEIPAKLGNNPIICFVRVDNNNLTGSLPLLKYQYPAGPDFPGLCTMSVTNNRLTGSVPATMLHFSDYGKNLLPQQTGFGFTNFK